MANWGMVAGYLCLPLLSQWKEQFIDSLSSLSPHLIFFPFLSFFFLSGWGQGGNRFLLRTGE